MMVWTPSSAKGVENSKTNCDSERCIHEGGVYNPILNATSAAISQVQLSRSISNPESLCRNHRNHKLANAWLSRLHFFWLDF
jgi:hypothetical protein